MALGMLFGVGPPSLLEILILLGLAVICIVLWRFILGSVAALLYIPLIPIIVVLEILLKLFMCLGDFLDFLVGYSFGANDNQPAATEPPPPDPINEAWVRYWMDQMDEASDEHLQQILREYE